MSQTSISIRRIKHCDTPFEFFRRPIEHVIASDILPSDTLQTVSLKSYVSPRGLYFPTLEVGPSDAFIPKDSVIAISASGSTIIGHRLWSVPISGYLVNGLKPLPKSNKILWTITRNNGDYLIVVHNHQVARLDGVTPNQVFPYWWNEGSLISLNTDAKSINMWHGDFIVIDPVTLAAQ